MSGTEWQRWGSEARARILTRCVKPNEDAKEGNGGLAPSLPFHEAHGVDGAPIRHLTTPARLSVMIMPQAASGRLFGSVCFCLLLSAAVCGCLLLSSCSKKTRNGIRRDRLRCDGTDGGLSCCNPRFAAVWRRQEYLSSGMVLVDARHDQPWSGHRALTPGGPPALPAAFTRRLHEPVAVVALVWVPLFRIGFNAPRDAQQCAVTPQVATQAADKRAWRAQSSFAFRRVSSRPARGALLACSPVRLLDCLTGYASAKCASGRCRVAAQSAVQMARLPPIQTPAAAFLLPPPTLLTLRTLALPAPPALPALPAHAIPAIPAAASGLRMPTLYGSAPLQFRPCPRIHLSSDSVDSHSHRPPPLPAA